MKKLILILNLIVAYTGLQAQISPAVFNSAGTNVQYSGGYLGWSVGETIIGSASVSTAFITQGFLQSTPIVQKRLLLSVFLQGLFNGSEMNKAQNLSGDQFEGNIADQVTIELHNAIDYETIEYTAYADLTTSGQIELQVPPFHSGSYYITIRHRNSIATTSAIPISFSGNLIDFSFDSPSKVFGGNLLLMAGGKYVIFSGDVNQDGLIDSGDITPVDNLASSFVSGYIPEDANGDGIMDSSDMIIVDNNAAYFVSVITP